MKGCNKQYDIQLVLFDFGGVLAEEGFRNGLMEIGRTNGLDSRGFYEGVCDIIRDCGYLTGRADEDAFWRAVLGRYEIAGTDTDMRETILSGFVLRPWMLAVVKGLKARGITTAMLSDQTDWLDELNRRHGFFDGFEHIFNSYYVHQSKHDSALFDTVVRRMGVAPQHALFIDDNEGHIQRARGRGLHTIHYIDREQFEEEFCCFFPNIP